MLLAPPDTSEVIELIKGENIKPLPEFVPLADRIAGPVLLKVGDNISTDAIMPAGARVLPFRSNIPAISQFVYIQVDETYPTRAMEHQKTGHFIIGGSNYGQGSSREHAALAPLFLGLKAVIVKSYARIHRQNLINFGILPFTFVNESDYDNIDQGDELSIVHLKQHLKDHKKITVHNKTKNENYEIAHGLTDRQIEIVLAGGIIALHRRQLQS
jgi:aconitate hydratase